MNKSKVLSILLLALITVTLAVSCSSNIDTPAANSEELSYVTFGNGHSRELGTSYTTENYDELFWFYTATKKDQYGTTGVTSTEKPVKATYDSQGAITSISEGLSGRVGPFSQGKWIFTLKAYSDLNGDKTGNNLVYEGTTTNVILKGGDVKNVPVSVTTQGNYGTLEVKDAYFEWYTNDNPALGAIGQGGGEAKPLIKFSLIDSNGTYVIEDLVIELQNKDEDTGRFYIANNTYSNNVGVGYYTAQVSVYLKQNATEENGNIAIDNEGTPVYRQSFGVRIYGNATTYISGNMVEGVDSKVTFDVPEQQMVIFTVEEDNTTTNVTVPVSPKGATEGETAENTTKKTEVSFPAGALDTKAVHQLNVTVTPTASAEQKFQVSGIEQVDGTRKTAVAGIDLTMVKVQKNTDGSTQEVPVTSFGKDSDNNDRKVTITTYIATGLSGVDVKYLNGNTLNNEGISNVVYTSSNGQLTFKTTHFSQYVVVSPVEALNVSTGVPYTSLADAIAAAGNGQEIQLKQNTCLTKSIVIDKDVSMDLNGKKITVSSPFEGVIAKTNEAPFYVKSGATFTINDTSTGETRGEIDVTGNTGVYSAVTLTISGAHDSSKTAKLVVNDGKLIGNYYAITTNGSRDNTSIVINGGYFKGSISNDNLAIYNPSVGTVEINGGTFEGYSSAIEIRAGELVINDGRFTSTANAFSCNPNGSGNTTVGAAIAIAQHTTKKDISVEINGGTFNGIRALNESNPQANDPKPQVSLSVTGGTFNREVSVTDVSGFISGGTFSSDPRSFIVDGCTVLNENNSFTVHHHPMWIDSADISWYRDESASEFTISSASELAGLAKLVNDGTANFKGKTVKITADIDLAGKSWTPIGPNADAATKFQGTLDGSYTENGKTKSHVISNMTVSQGASYRAAGFFGALNGTARYLEFDNASVTSLSAPNNEGGTDNGNAVVAGSIYTSGAIEYVTVKNSSVSANRYVGGIAGYVYGKVEYCVVEGIDNKNTTLTATPDKLTGSYDNGDKLGGIVGYLSEQVADGVFKNRVNNIVLHGYRDIGGIVGCTVGAPVKNNDAGNVKIIKDYSLISTVQETYNQIVGRTKNNPVIEGNETNGKLTIESNPTTES